MRNPSLGDADRTASCTAYFPLPHAPEPAEGLMIAVVNVHVQSYLNIDFWVFLPVWAIPERAVDSVVQRENPTLKTLLPIGSVGVGHGA